MSAGVSINLQLGQRVRFDFAPRAGLTGRIETLELHGNDGVTAVVFLDEPLMYPATELEGVQFPESRCDRLAVKAIDLQPIDTAAEIFEGQRDELIAALRDIRETLSLVESGAAEGCLVRINQALARFEPQRQAVAA